jgi:hypothetical protein
MRWWSLSPDDDTVEIYGILSMEAMFVKSEKIIAMHSEVCPLLEEYSAIACVRMEVPAPGVERTDHVSRTNGPCRIRSGS